MSAPSVQFQDYCPPPASLRDEVLQGLGRRPKRIPPKFFYDDRGSHLFDEICRQPEYYPTRTEMELLRLHVADIAHLAGTDCMLIELGSGSNQKVRQLLDSLQPRAYVSVDISRDYLLQSASDLARDYPWLEVHAACADFSHTLQLPHAAGLGKRIAFFPGSSIGNFEPDEARRLLANIAHVVQPDGGLLIGADLKKDPRLLDAAYNDARGITAAFNLNLLRRINRELQANFKLENFSHYAAYNEQLGRVEMHLISRVDQTVSVAGHSFHFAVGETLHTENSYKYGIEEFQDLVGSAGFEHIRTWTDPEQLFGVFYFTSRP